MPGQNSIKRTKESNMCFKDSIPTFKAAADAKDDSQYQRNHFPILPGLPDDVSKHCLALVPRAHFPSIASVCKSWRSFIKSKEFITVRKLAGVLEEWLYVLTMDADGKGTHWEVLDCLGHKHRELPKMPGPAKAGFGLSVVNGKLLIVGGYFVVDDALSVSRDVYQYDSCLNSWTKLASMNTARYDFACTEVNEKVYAVGGCGSNGESLSCAEAYDPDTDTWTVIEPLRFPRWGCFACGLHGKLYVMGGRSSFTIGNSRSIDVYTPDKGSWSQMKKGCVMVMAHAVLGRRLFCVEWKNERTLAVFDSVSGSWEMVRVPVNGSSRVGFRFGILGGRLLLFSSVGEDRSCRGGGGGTLVYDPDAEPGREWGSSGIRVSGFCQCVVTIRA